MPKYLLLISPERLAAQALSPSELGQQTQDVVDWIDVLRQKGSLEFGALLAKAPSRLSLDCAKSVDGRRPDAIRGPGAPIRLCFSIDVPTMDDASQVAASCPSAHPGIVDVFEIEARIAMQGPSDDR